MYLWTCCIIPAMPDDVAIRDGFQFRSQRPMVRSDGLGTPRMVTNMSQWATALVCLEVCCGVCFTVGVFFVAVVGLCSWATFDTESRLGFLEKTLEAKQRCSEQQTCHLSLELQSCLPRKSFLERQECPASKILKHRECRAALTQPPD